MDRYEKASLTKNDLLETLHAVTDVETKGCWAGITKNIDGQVLSAGVFQWNYGQGSIQPILGEFKSRFERHEFKDILINHMPKHGRDVFSAKCLALKPKKEAHPCEILLLDKSDPKGKELAPEIQAEFTKIFESNIMVEVQMDEVIRKMDRTLRNAQKLFASKQVTKTQFYWLLDLAVQQGGISNLDKFAADAKRAVEFGASKDKAHRDMTVKGILAWYAGLAFSPDQDGIQCDWKYNLEKWRLLLDGERLTDEKYQLLIMTWLRSRTAAGQSGRWQALAFQRRAKIALGVGSVGSSSVHKDNRYKCIRPTPSDFQSIFSNLN